MRTIQSGRRGCGHRKAGGVYLTSEGSSSGVLPLWVSLNPPVPCEDRPYRGLVLVDAEAVLNELPEEEWFVGSSAEYRQKLRADQWSLARFGMTTTMRLRTGECKGLQGVDEAMEYLLSHVRYSGPQLTDVLLGLVSVEIHEIPGITVHYARFISLLQEFDKEGLAEHLVHAAAMVWMMASIVPPRKRRIIIPYLMRVLVVLGLLKDALAMKRRYL